MGFACEQSMSIRAAWTRNLKQVPLGDSPRSMVAIGGPDAFPFAADKSNFRWLKYYKNFSLVAVARKIGNDNTAILL